MGSWIADDAGGIYGRVTGDVMCLVKEIERLRVSLKRIDDLASECENTSEATFEDWAKVRKICSETSSLRAGREP